MTAHPYDGCDDCLARTRRLLRPGPSTSALPGAKPTPAQLARHAERFGSEGVAETAAELGVDVDVAPDVKPRRRRRPRR